MMAERQEIEHLKASIAKLEDEVARLKTERRGLKDWQRFIIGFAIVFAGMLASIGVLQFITRQ
jgi:hypothetical protein